MSNAIVNDCVEGFKTELKSFMKNHIWAIKDFLGSLDKQLKSSRALMKLLLRSELFLGTDWSKIWATRNSSHEFPGNYCDFQSGTKILCLSPKSF